METRRKRGFSVGGLFNNLSVDSENHDNAIKYAMFNGIAILIVLVGSVAACGVYFILQPFIKPLLWALLCGSALHPFKNLLAKKFKLCIVSLEQSSKGMYGYILFLPLILISKLSDLVGDYLVKHLHMILKTLGVVSATIVAYVYTPEAIVRSFWLFFELNRALLNITLNMFSSILMVSSVCVAYSLSLVFVWKPGRRGVFLFGALTVWVAVTSYLSGLIPTFRMPLFVLCQLSLVLGYLYNSMYQKNASDATKSNEEMVGSQHKKPEEFSFEKSYSVMYIKWLAVACLAVVALSLAWVHYILLLLLILYAAKKLCISFGVTDSLQGHYSVLFGNMKSWLSDREDVLLPTPLKNALKMISVIWEKELSMLKGFCDSAASIAVILGLLLVVVFCSVFLSVQAYKESVYFVQSGGSVINTTIVHNPELHEMLPEGWESTLDSALNNAYIYVREALENIIRSLLKDKGISDARAVELEKSALELWDRVYQAWVMPLQPTQGSSGPTVTAEAVILSYTTFIERLRKTPEVMSLNSLGVLRENMSTISAGLDSLWALLKGNVYLLLNILYTLFSLIFGGGMSVINFTLHMVVFLTALFYLLSTSRELYKPVELITQISPKYGNKLALAIENSCREVLSASVKLSIFYGMWTWLIHTLFQSNIVYMPAVFAAVLGCVPVLGTYWVCLPALLDLWLVQNSPIWALGLLSAQVLPVLIVDSMVYNEIQGSGHPYLSGLSVAGGLFWLGIEGAVIGPLMLCFLFVIINMASGLAHHSTPPSPAPSISK